MKILAVSDNFYEIRYGHGNGFNIEGPFYSAQSAFDAATRLMTEELSRPMNTRTSVLILQNGKLHREFRRIESGVWKEFQVL